MVTVNGYSEWLQRMVTVNGYSEYAYAKYVCCEQCVAIASGCREWWLQRVLTVCGDSEYARHHVICKVLKMYENAESELET